MAANVEHSCPLCNTLGETTLTLSRVKGVLKVRLEKDDIITSMKEQMAKTYGIFGNQNSCSLHWCKF